MPVFNAESYLRDSIESVLCQTFSDFEFIIINDACTDNSSTILNSYKDSRIKVFNNELNLGLTKSLNRAIESSIGKYIARTDADDICLPRRFETQVQFLEKHSEIGLCGSWFENFGDIRGIAKYNPNHNEILVGLLYQCQFCHPSVIMRKEVLSRYSLLYNTNFITAQDYELWARMAHVCISANVPEVLLQYRVHAQSISAKKKEQQLSNRNRIIIGQFEKMGVAISHTEIDLFVKFCNSNFEFNVEELNKLEEFLERAVVANDVSGFITKTIFSEFVTEKWFHLCYNSNVLASMRYQKYYSSKLLDEKRMDCFSRLKFKLRSLL